MGIKQKFKKGDIVWCTKICQYDITGYHVPCVVVKIINNFTMDVCRVNEWGTQEEQFYTVEVRDFAKCPLTFANSKKSDQPPIEDSHLGEGEFLIPADYDYRIIQNEDGSAILKCTKIDNTERIEEWKDEAITRITRYKDSPEGKSHNIRCTTTGKYSIAVGEFGDGVRSEVARWNNKDKWDTELGQCIATYRLLQWDIPDYVVGE